MRKCSSTLISQNGDRMSTNTSQNGNDRLGEAMAVLIQDQAAFVAQLADSERHRAENERQHLRFERETRGDVALMKAQMAKIIHEISEHNSIIERATEAVREKIGFKGP